jgi:hypothetical protein
MRAVLIDPFTKTVQQIETPGDLRDIYKAIQCDTIDAAYLTDGKHCIYVDDNGLTYTDKVLPVFRWQGYDQPLAGRGLLMGYNKAGANCDCDIPVGVVWSHVTFPALVIDEITTHEYTREDGVHVIRNTPIFKRTGKE